MKARTPIIPDWRWGTAEGSRELDRILDQRLSFREKIQWLEEAENLTILMAAERARRSESKPTGEGDRSGDESGGTWHRP